MSGPEKISLDQEKKEESSEISEQEKKNLDKVSSQELSVQLKDVETPEAFDLSKNIQKLGDINLSSQERNTLAESTLNKVLTSPTLLAQYLPYIKADSLRYIGSDAETQIKLYNLLVSSPFYKNLALEGSDIQNNLLAVRLAITTKNTVSLNDQMKDLSNQTKEKVADFFTQFGSAILSIANLLGGKDALKQFFLKFNVNLDTNIDDLYKNTYQVDTAKLQAIHDGFSGSTTNDIEPYYSSEDRLNSNFTSLDPNLIDRANQSSLKIPDLVISDGSLYGEAKYKINSSVLGTLQVSDKQKIISQIFKDPTLWQNINKLQDPLTAASVYGKENPKKDQDWYTKCPDFKNPKELCVVVGAYLMKGSNDIKYVLNESHLPYEEVHKQQWDIKNKKPEATQDISTDTLKNDWNTLFSDLDTGKWKDYPLTSDAENKLDALKKVEYSNYKKAVSEKISTLIDPNTPDFSSLQKDTVIKAKIDPFLTKHFGVYLASLKDNTSIYTDTNRKSIEAVISKFVTIKTGISVSLSVDGKISISGKDATKPTAKEIKIESSAFSWFPIKK